MPKPPGVALGRPPLRWGPGLRRVLGRNRLCYLMTRREIDANSHSQSKSFGWRNPLWNQPFFVLRRGRHPRLDPHPFFFFSKRASLRHLEVRAVGERTHAT